MTTVKELQSAIASLERQKEQALAMFHQSEGAIKAYRHLLGETMRQEDKEAMLKKRESVLATANGEAGDGERCVPDGAE